MSIKGKIKGFRRKIKIVNRVSEKTGWSRREVIRKAKKAKELTGISLKDYEKLGFYGIDESEQAAEYKKILRSRKQEQKNREQCISLYMQYNKCGKKEAAKAVDKTLKTLGISSAKYRRCGLFLIPEEEQAEVYEQNEKVMDLRKNTHDNKRHENILQISKAAGWTLEETKKALNEAREYSGATPKDFYALRFWEIEKEDQRKYFTQKLSNTLSAYYDTEPYYRDILLNKELSCHHFEQFLKRPWCINTRISFEEFKDMFGDAGKVIYKPLNGNGGLGVEIFSFTDDNIEEKYKMIHGLGRGILEAVVQQHPEMSRLNPSSVNTLRVVTISKPANKKKGEDRIFGICYAALRVGRSGSVVDNTSSGGMVCGVDLETGKLDTDGGNLNGEYFISHPDTGVTFRGFQIPMFKEAMEMVAEAGKLIDGYTGWDVAISVDGPVLIEANIMPGNRILEMPYLNQRTKDNMGRRFMMEKYIQEAAKSPRHLNTY